MSTKKENKLDSSMIIINKRIYHEYSILERLEAGIVLQGWEVKSLRARKVNICNSYIIFKDGEAFLIGVNFTPLVTIFTAHYVYNPTRVRKLLLNQKELKSLYGYIHRKGYAIIVLSLYWKKAWCKAGICVAKGKKQKDKRYDIKNREWNINKARVIKNACPLD